MKVLDDLLKDLEGFADQQLDNLQSAGVTIIEKVVPVLEDAFAALLKALGELAVKIVLDLMHGAQASLKGIEKHNLAVTTLTEQAELNGIAASPQDLGTLVKTAYLSVMSAGERKLAAA